MEFIRSWIFSVTIAAMVVAVANGVMPKGATSKAATFLFGLVLMLGILQPIVRLDYEDLFVLANGMSDVVVESEEEAIKNNNVWMKSIIEDELSAYVLDKAKNSAEVSHVSVFCEEGENGEITPASVQMKGRFSEEGIKALKILIVEELGIPEQQQDYIEEGLS